jgi:ADP-ribose pyrophosphatase
MRPDSEETVYAGRWLSVTLERWDDSRREIVRRPDVVAVVAVDREGFLTLVRQFRPGARRPLLELPAGLVEPGEEPLDTARRELEEETGLRGGRWRSGPSFWTTPGFCNERVHVFVAEDLERGEASPDEGEEIEVERWSLVEAAGRLGELEDGKTLAGLHHFLAEQR